MAAFPCVCILFFVAGSMGTLSVALRSQRRGAHPDELAGGGARVLGREVPTNPRRPPPPPPPPSSPPTKVLRLSSISQPQSGILKRGGPPPALGGGGGGGAPGPADALPGFLRGARRCCIPPRVKEGPGGLEVRKRQGLRMWQQAVSKAEHRGKVSLVALSLKDARLQSCSAVPFTQRVRAEGCEEVTLRNKLCFGQCNSLFVPSGEEEEEEEGAGRARRGACSRCSPSRSHEVRVPLRCGSKGLLERRVMVVEECRCESGREEGGLGL
ncbi:hypothetical protein CRUP_012536 [Coryphaenoides rupestris]|nr:hypothetical protein CRUP_012536 [Coryphaenoides rupestris]